MSTSEKTQQQAPAPSPIPAPYGPAGQPGQLPVYYPPVPPVQPVQSYSYPPPGNYPPPPLVAPTQPVQPQVQPQATQQPQQVVMISNASVPRFPTKLYCPHCKKEVTTVINYENNAIIWFLCILLFLFTFCLLFIPFLIKDLKDVVHYCPYCRREIARNERM